MDEALSAHRHLVEQFVAEAPSLAARLVKTERIYSRAQRSEEINDFVGALGDQERELLARMIQESRTEAIFDSLRVLHEACALDGLRLRQGSAELPVEPYGYSLFEEFLTVLQDGNWSALGG